MTTQTKVTLLFRKRSPHFNSIEELFNNLTMAMKEQVQVNTVQLNRFSNGLINKIENIRQVAALPKGILHITGEVYYAGLFFRGRLIVTVHDIGSIKRGSVLKQKFIKWLWFQRIAKQADAVVLISEQARKEYLEEIKIDPKKVHLIHNSVPPQLKYTRHYFNHQCPVLLQIGTKPNKNIERLIEAVATIPCHLKIVGKLTPQQKELLKQKNVNYSNFCGVSTEMLHRFYEEADLITFVSTYEGFGMPVIEGQACGRVVITSTISSLPEVAGDGALLVDPYSVAAIRNGILRLINEPDFREKLIQKGLKNQERFDIKHIAQQYVELYQHIEWNGAN
jgi:glycosyltransferase involved in cell wall biosynthesis